jgi:hypothetical protein
LRRSVQRTGRQLIALLHVYQPVDDEGGVGERRQREARPRTLSLGVQVVERVARGVDGVFLAGLVVEHADAAVTHGDDVALVLIADDGVEGTVVIEGDAKASNELAGGRLPAPIAACSQALIALVSWFGERTVSSCCDSPPRNEG